MSDINGLVQPVMENGPRRILCDKHTAVSWRRRPHLRICTIFVRDDGWSLGAPEDLVFAALATWKDQWFAVIEYGYPKAKVVPYDVWVQQTVSDYMNYHEGREEEFYRKYERRKLNEWINSP